MKQALLYYFTVVVFSSSFVLFGGICTFHAQIFHYWLFEME